MIDEIDIATARALFAHAIEESEHVPDSARVEIRADPALGDAAVFHCGWPLADKGQRIGKYSKEITVQVTAAAMNRFRAADPREQGTMLARFVRVFNGRLLDEQYSANDPPSPPLVVQIDERSLDA